MSESTNSGGSVSVDDVSGSDGRHSERAEPTQRGSRDSEVDSAAVSESDSSLGADPRLPEASTASAAGSEDASGHVDAADHFEGEVRSAGGTPRAEVNSTGGAAEERGGAGHPVQHVASDEYAGTGDDTAWAQPGRISRGVFAGAAPMGGGALGAAMLAKLPEPPALRADAAVLRSADAYLEHYDLPFYLQDAVSLMMSAKPADPLKFMYAYFRSVVSGHNIHKREFSYISATVGNRLAFVSLLDGPLTGFAPESELLPDDALQVVRLLCTDIPESLFANATALLRLPTTEPVPLEQLLSCVLILTVFSDMFLELAHFCVQQRTGASKRLPNDATSRLELWPLASPPWLPDLLDRTIPPGTEKWLQSRVASPEEPLWAPPEPFLEMSGEVTYGEFCRKLCSSRDLIAWTRAVAHARATSSKFAGMPPVDVAAEPRPKASTSNKSGSAGGSTAGSAKGRGGGSVRARR